MLYLLAAVKTPLFYFLDPSLLLVLTSAAGAISSVPMVTGTGEVTISVHTVSIRITVMSIHTALINIYN